MNELGAESLSNLNCLVLLSGGIDSSACIDFYKRQKFKVSGLHINYGQSASAPESTASTAIAQYYNIPLKQLIISGSRKKEASEVLGRNAFFIFTALTELEINAGIIVLGIHSGTPYFDCSPIFISKIQEIIDGQLSGSIKISTPFIKWSKQDIWYYCKKYHVPIELTYSCERGGIQPCGTCMSCKDLEALLAS